MKILFLPKYPPLGASSRLRTYQYLNAWREAGYEAKASSFFTRNYLNRFYTGKRPYILNVLYCYVRRFWVLLSSFRYDLIWIEKEVFPFLPSYAEWILEKMGKGYVVDYDDAVFHTYDQSPNWLVRTWMGDKIDWVMRHSNRVFVGNEYLRNRAENARAKTVILLPTVIDPSRYRKKVSNQEPKEVRIGWIGSPTTLKYLMALQPVFKKLSQRLDFELILVNARPFLDIDLGCSVRWIPWTEETEVESILAMDIGLMPLPDDKWERGKCAYKLIQYMACSLPVVASPVGMNQEVVKHGENGFLAANPEEWEKYLEMLILDKSLREKMGEYGFLQVQEKYTLKKNFEIMEKTIIELLNGQS